MSTNLRWIGEKARRETKLVCTGLYHHITDVGNLRDGYNALPKFLEGFRSVLSNLRWPKPIIRIDLKPCCRAEAR